MQWLAWLGISEDFPEHGRCLVNQGMRRADLAGCTHLCKGFALRWNVEPQQQVDLNGSLQEGISFVVVTNGILACVRLVVKQAHFLLHDGVEKRRPGIVPLAEFVDPFEQR